MTFRTHIARLVASLAVLAGVGVAHAGVPAWVDSMQPAFVARTQPSAQGDVVVLAGGQDRGIRPGMQCQIRHADAKIADLVVVAARADRSATLILSSDHAIRQGDIVKIKTL